MEIDIFSNEELLGTAIVRKVDNGMNVAGGPFHPTPLYNDKLRQLFRESTDLSFNPTELRRLQREPLCAEIRKLNLCARTKKGKILDLDGGVDLLDLFNEVTNEDLMEVYLLGLSGEDFSHIPEFEKSPT
jgi:hypothetical protein